MSIAATAEDKQAPFRPKAAGAYEFKNTLDRVTVAVEPYESEEKQKPAFGKISLFRFNILPVLVVIENNRPTPLDVARMKLTYRPRGSNEIEPIPAQDVRFMDGPNKPKVGSQPFPIPMPVRVKKSKLNDPVIEERAFAAKMIAPGESASGFVYFWTEYHGPALATITGLRDSRAAQDLFYIEIPFDHR